MILELILIGIVAVVAWCVASDGAWGAAFTLLSVVIAGLLATCLFEMTASFLQQNIAASYDWRHRWDVIALVGLFSGLVFALRMATEYIMPVDIEMHGMVFDIARWSCGLLTGYVTMAFLLAALHTAPLPREFLGFTPEPSRRAGPVGQAAPDMHWLGYVHFMTETAFGRPGGPIFDGPRIEMDSGGPELMLPSFPIRYASRRAQYFGAASVPTAGSASSTPARAEPGGPPINTTKLLTDRRPLPLLEAASYLPSTEGPPLMIAHNVYFSLKDNSPEAVDRMVRACHTFLSEHEGIVFFAAGVLAEEFAREVNDRDFQVALHLAFTDRQAHDRYQDSERHQQFIAENRENWSHVRVFDSLVEN